MAVNSRQKGARAERALAKLLREYGFEDARRGRQFNGLDGSPDVLGLTGVHIECKHVERLNIHDAMEQSARDAKGMDIPIVAHKKNNKPWLVTMRLEEFLMMYKMAGIDDGDLQERSDVLLDRQKD